MRKEQWQAHLKKVSEAQVSEFTQSQSQSLLISINDVKSSIKGIQQI